VLAEVRRVLRPGGVVIFSQSNRVFFTKAIRMWLSMGDEVRRLPQLPFPTLGCQAHLELIGQYLKYAGFSKRPRAFDISAKGRGAKDPMYIVECEK
jgi:SAM-dependent methyltransferase